MLKADTNLRYRVKPVPAAGIDDYLSRGERISQNGVTLYFQTKPALEVGFLIKKRAGKAVFRNRTRRLFWGLIHNHILDFRSDGGYVFLFHRYFFSSESLYSTLHGITTKVNRSN